MEQGDRAFWIALSLGTAVSGTVLGAGINGLMEGRYFYGACLAVLGLAIAVSTVLHLIGKWVQFRSGMLGALILTWLFLGYDIYDHHPVIPMSATASNPVSSSAIEHQITLERGLDFIRDLGMLQGKVKIRITAPPIRIAVRNQIVSLLMFPESLTTPSGILGNFLSNRTNYMNFDPSRIEYTQLARNIILGPFRFKTITRRFGGFEIIDNTPDSKIPAPNPDADATPTPVLKLPEETIIHAPENSDNANALQMLLEELGLKVKRGYSLPPDVANQQNLIYIQIGTGPLWK